jgi:hypothetical protein
MALLRAVCCSVVHRETKNITCVMDFYDLCLEVKLSPYERCLVGGIQKTVKLLFSPMLPVILNFD